MILFFSLAQFPANFLYLGIARYLLLFYKSHMALVSIVYFTKTATGKQMSGKKEAGGGWTFLLQNERNSGTEISQAEIVDLLFQNQAENTQK